MIGRRTALGLAGGAVLLSGAAWLAGGQTPPADLTSGGEMFPGLAARLPQAARVEIVHRGSTLALARAESGWALPDHADYPVLPAPLHGLLAALAELRLQEPRTDDPDLYGKLGLDDPTRPDSAGTLLRVLAGDGTPLAAVIAGHGPDGLASETFVRRPGEARSWLAAGALDASAEWLDWVDRLVVDVLPEDVVTVTSQRVDGPALSVAARDGGFVLTEPAEHAVLDPYRLADMARVLSGLRFLDVTRAEAMPGQAIGEATLTTRAGLVARVAASRDADRLWLRLVADGTGSDALTARSGWAYQVAPTVEQALLPRLADLVAYQAAAAQPPPAPVARARRK